MIKSSFIKAIPLSLFPIVQWLWVGISLYSLKKVVGAIKIPTTQVSKKPQGKPLAMSFKPASAKDEEIIVNALPEADDNGEIDPSKIPTGFSSSLKMSAEVTLDGEVIESGNTYGFGSEVITQIGFENPSKGITYTINTAEGLSEKTIRAGEYHAIGYDMQGLSQQQLEKTSNKLENVREKLEDYESNKDNTVLVGLSNHDTIGSMLQATVQSYFAVNDFQDKLALSQTKDIVATRFMSYGTYHTYIEPNSKYGITFGGSMKGLQMDIDKLLRMGVAKDNDLSKLAMFNQIQGMRQSLNESSIPEQILNGENETNNRIEGISATKAIQLAMNQGQKIVTITKENYNDVINTINVSADIMSEISSAINAEKQVIIHANKLNYQGWSGFGYIILDTQTGTGAYLISGGANGGQIILGAGGMATAMSYGAITPEIKPSDEVQNWIDSASALGFKPAKFLKKFEQYLNVLKQLKEIILECRGAQQIIGVALAVIATLIYFTIVSAVAYLVFAVGSMICRNVFCGAGISLFITPHITQPITDYYMEFTDDMIKTCKGES